MALICAFLLLNGAALRASDWVGIYAILERVVFEPNESAPERIKIWGAFVVPVPMSSNQYKAAARGYLYFKVAPGKEEITRKEWADLKSVAGTGQGIGFAQYWVSNSNDPAGNPHRALDVRVHKASESAVPDVYPLGIGIVKMSNQGNQLGILTQLKKVLNPQ
jgi:hypothetical protein